MRLKLFVAATVFVAAPIVAFAQKDDPATQASKPTIEEVQKVVQTISSDKNKLQAY
jgi:type IV secretory pathway VirB2 component (pilin)